MRKLVSVAFLASMAILFAAGCATKPVYNVTAAPVAMAKPGATLDDVAKAIVRAGAALGWQMNETAPGKMVATLYLRTHVAVVDIAYDLKAYSITYKDSTNLQYDGMNIHSNYNGWIQNLDKGIRTQLSLL